MRLIRVVRTQVANDDVVRFRVELPSSARILAAKLEETEPVQSPDREFVVHLAVASVNDDYSEVEHEFMLVSDGARFDLPVNNTMIHAGFIEGGCVVIYYLGPLVNELRYDEAV